MVGIDLDGDVIGKLGEEKGGDALLRDSSKRAAESALGPPDGSRALHHAAHQGRAVGRDAAKEQLATPEADQLPAFTAAHMTLLDVLPVQNRMTQITDEARPVADAASALDVLEQLHGLACRSKAKTPRRLKFWMEKQR
ncbi:uncharacterized protein SOCEGT47_062790 [Sorangium cellulosum]|uniref:Uncharacterized protein n=1 Tax=Sorangium cellulosum TaxID=56 RepID=A0A4P2Q8A3_SORCE|nr:uncharacterized protein SOCEGT47_062790 [Sorangium cellulosum]